MGLAWPGFALTLELQCYDRPIGAWHNRHAESRTTESPLRCCTWPSLPSAYETSIICVNCRPHACGIIRRCVTAPVTSLAAMPRWSMAARCTGSSPDRCWLVSGSLISSRISAMTARPARPSCWTPTSLRWLVGRPGHFRAGVILIPMPRRATCRRPESSTAWTPCPRRFARSFRRFVCCDVERLNCAGGQAVRFQASMTGGCRWTRYGLKRHAIRWQLCSDQRSKR